MNKFKITVARIEVVARGEQDAQVRITFQVDRAPISFRLPVLLSIKDFDDTEMVQAARNALHRTFAELAAQSRKWKLTAQDSTAAFEHELASKAVILAWADAERRAPVQIGPPSLKIAEKSGAVVLVAIRAWMAVGTRLDGGES